MLSTKTYYWFIAGFIMCQDIYVTSVTIALISIFGTIGTMYCHIDICA